MTNREYLEKLIKEMDNKQFAKFLNFGLAYHYNLHAPFIPAYPFDKPLGEQFVKAIKWGWDADMSTASWLDEERRE